MWTKHDQYYSKTLMSKTEYNIQVEEQVWNSGIIDLLKDQKYICGYYIVSGELTIYDITYHKDTLIWFTGGTSFNINSKDNAHLIYMETNRELTDQKLAYKAYIDQDLSWAKPIGDEMTSSKHMITAEEYGVKIQTGIYTKDFDHAWHTHSAAHGFYVLNGMLKFDFENGNKGIYGPGEFIASSPGEQVLHLQAEGSSYCKYLFIGDGPFDFIVNGINLYKK